MNRNTESNYIITALYENKTVFCYKIQNDYYYNYNNNSYNNMKKKKI